MTGPGISSTITLDLDPANSIMICFLPDPEGVPHFALRMALPITVTPSTGPAAAEPEPTLTMDLVDFGFELSGPITGGSQVIEVTNPGAELHEFIVTRLDPGTTGEEFLAAFGEFIERTSTEPLPGETLGGLQAIYPGLGGFYSANFTPDEYLVFCPVDDQKGGPPHFVLGMLHELTVQ